MQMISNAFDMMLFVVVFNTSPKINETCFTNHSAVARQKSYNIVDNILEDIYFPFLFLFYILRNFVKMKAVLLILDKCNLYISQNTKFVKTMDMKIQYDTTPIERCNFRSLYGETSCFSI